MKQTSLRKNYGAPLRDAKKSKNVLNITINDPASLRLTYFLSLLSMGFHAILDMVYTFLMLVLAWLPCSSVGTHKVKPKLSDFWLDLH